MLPIFAHRRRVSKKILKNVAHEFDSLSDANPIHSRCAATVCPHLRLSFTPTRLMPASQLLRSASDRARRKNMRSREQYLMDRTL
jgi:hypothetical protein